LYFAYVNDVAGTTAVVVASAVVCAPDVAIVAAFANISQLLLMPMPAVALHDSDS
jgi:hypothetical protein